MTALHIGIGTGSLWTNWSLDPIALIGIPLAAILYYRGLQSLGARRRFHGTWRPSSFYAGLFALAVALLSPLDHLSDELFMAHMTQHMLLMMVGVPLVLLGAPILPILRGIPRPIRRRVVIPTFRSPPVRFVLRTLSRPLVAWPAFIFSMFAWHLPALYEAALGNEALHLLEHAVFVIGAYLFWWNVIDPHPLRPNLQYLVRVPYIFLTVVPAFALGAFLTFADGPWYATYIVTAPLHGLTPIEDQQLGGVIMWVPGSFIIGAALVLDLYVAIRNEQEERVIEEALTDRA
jgi:putative membrane protein